MATRDLKENLVQSKYFASSKEIIQEMQDTGTKDMRPLLPFIISGGSNTERYYFIHITATTEYKFTIKPEYFADESSYTDVFPKKIQQILSKNNDARIFCVFDWDTVYDNKTRLEKHAKFEAKLQAEISAGIVTLCPSMPCIEYWFLLHFTNHTDFLKNYSKVSSLLSSFIKPCFPNPSIAFKKLMKKEKYLKEPEWVINLCKNGKLDDAIKRAECNILQSMKNSTLEKESYTFVYKVFK